MAEKLRGIEADFATWRPVQGRKVLQLIFEVPIEQTQNVLDMLGIPQPGESKWCAIALMNNPPSGPSKTKLPEAPASGGGPILQAERSEGGSPKPFSTLPLSQQAAIRCGDETFRDFISTLGASGIGRYTPEMAADMVRSQCAVKSRADLDDDVNHIDARNRWLYLERTYQRWLTDVRYAGSKR